MTLIKTLSFKKEIVDVKEFKKKLKELETQFPGSTIEIRIGQEWDGWNQRTTPILLCVYSKEN